MPDTQAERDIDVLHLGIFSDRRATSLAAGARWLSEWRCHLVLGDQEGPNAKDKANFATGDSKWDLLTRSRLLLNIHVSERPYFEWMRVVQAVGCGCSIVSEHSVGEDPLVPGEHFLSARSEALGLVAHGLLSNEELRALISRRAYHFLRTELPFSASVAGLVDIAEELAARRRREGPRRPGQLPKLVVEPVSERGPPVGVPTRYPATPADTESSALRAALKDVRLDLLQLGRDVARLRRESAAGRPLPAVEVDRASSGYGPAKPRVTVVTPSTTTSTTSRPPWTRLREALPGSRVRRGRRRVDRRIVGRRAAIREGPRGSGSPASASSLEPRARIGAEYWP